MVVLNIFFSIFPKALWLSLNQAAVLSLFNFYPKKDYINTADICLTCFLQKRSYFPGQTKGVNLRFPYLGIWDPTSE